MDKRNKGYEDGEFWEAPLGGTGVYQFTGANDYETELRNPIGFVRPKNSRIIPAPSQIGRIRSTQIIQCQTIKTK